VENPYLSVETAETVPNNAAHNKRGFQAMQRSIVMLKNSRGIIHQANAGTAKPAVYIPRVYSAATTGRRPSPASANPAFELEAAAAHFNVVTDQVATTLTGPADDAGNPTLSPNDIIRASAADIAKCDFAVVRITSPQSGNATYMGFGAGLSKLAVEE
jgi:beta-glucosidase